MDEVMEVRAVRVAHALNAVVLLGTFAAAILRYRREPDRIPVHFDLAGFPDRWVDRSFGYALATPLVGLASAALTYGMAQIFVGWARRRPEMLNLPDKEAFLALPPELQVPIWRQMKAIFYWLAVPQTLVSLMIVVLGFAEDVTFRVWRVLVPMSLFVLFLVLLTVLGVRLLRRVRMAIAAGARRIPA